MSGLSNEMTENTTLHASGFHSCPSDKEKGRIHVMDALGVAKNALSSNLSETVASNDNWMTSSERVSLAHEHASLCEKSSPRVDLM